MSSLKRRGHVPGTVLVVLLTCVHYVEGQYSSEFYGGIFTWAPTGNGTEVRIDLRLSWDSTRHPCNRTMIANNMLIAEGTASCYTTNCDMSSSLRVHCTDFSNGDWWSTGRSSFTYTPPAGLTRFSFGYEDTDGSGSWSLRTTADVSIRTDINRINSSPRVEMFPLVLLQQGCSQTIKLPVFDPDGDIVRCRFARNTSQTGDECADMCDSFKNATLNSDTCKLSYTGTGSAGMYGVAIQIEDFESSSSTIAISSVPLQFVVSVFLSNSPCGSAPVFHEATPKQDACFPLLVNQSFDFQITAVASSGRTIEDIDTVRPSTVTRTRDVSIGNNMTTNINWIPTLADKGIHAVCFTACDSKGLRSEQRCVRLYVEAGKPELSEVRKSEKGDTVTWELIYDRGVTRPTSDAYIWAFFENGTMSEGRDVTSDDVVYGPSSIRFSFTGDFAASYNIRLDADCSQPPTFPHGSWNVTSTLYGGIATATCDAGFNMAGGDEHHRCDSDGTWSGLQPTCDIVDCGDVQPIYLGNVTVTGTTYGEKAVYTCAFGLNISPVASKERVCTAEGTWSKQEPSCTFRDCLNPPKINNGWFTISGRTYGHNVTYTCIDGYFLTSGSLIRRCGVDGIWTGISPTCGEKYSTGDVCLSDLPRTSQCRDKDVSCRFDNSTGAFRCICEPGHIHHPDEKLCLKRKRYGERCEIGRQCQTFLSECVNDTNGQGTCTCTAGRMFNSTADECATRAIMYCEASNDRTGRLWGKTKIGTKVYQECPAGFTGQILRTCYNDGKFSLALYNCTKEILQRVAVQLQSGKLTTSEALETIKDAVTEIHNNSIEIFTGDVDAIEKVLTDIAFKEPSTSATSEEVHTDATNFLDIANMLTDPKKSGPAWESKLEQTNKGAEKFTETVDRYAQNIATTLTARNGTDMSIERENIAVTVSMVKDDTDEYITYPQQRQESFWDTSQMSLPKTALSGKEDNVTSVVVVVYRNLSMALPKTNVQTSTQSKEREIISQVMSVQLLPKPPKMLKPPIKLTFKTDKRQTGFASHCSFWKPEKVGTAGGWSTLGCVKTLSTPNAVQCSCNHLTNFAILISPAKASDHHAEVLSYLTLTGCAISILCLIVTILLHVVYWRSVKGDRNILAMAVCVTLLVAYLLFAFGINRTSIKVVCTSIAVSLHYLFLLVFFLMLAEGVFLAIKATFMMHKKSHLRELLIGSFVFPAIIVLVVASAVQLDGYGNDKHCWLTLHSVAFWMFAGPALVVSLFNLCVIVLVMRKMYGIQAIKNMDQRKKAKTLASKMLVLLPAMGVTWVFGILAVDQNSVWLQYMFVIFNSLQGVFIFLFHCVLNEQLKKAIMESRKPPPVSSEGVTKKISNTITPTTLATAQTNVELSTICHRDGGHDDKDIATDEATTDGNVSHLCEDTLIDEGEIRKESSSSIASEEERQRFKKRHAIPSHAYVGGDKLARPSTQVFMELQHELRERLRNIFMRASGLIKRSSHNKSMQGKEDESQMQKIAEDNESLKMVGSNEPVRNREESKREDVTTPAASPVSGDAIVTAEVHTTEIKDSLFNTAEEKELLVALEDVAGATRSGGSQEEESRERCSDVEPVIQEDNEDLEPVRKEKAEISLTDPTINVYDTNKNK